MWQIHIACLPPMPTILKCKNKPQYVTTYTELRKEQQQYTTNYNNEVIEHRVSYLSVR